LSATARRRRSASNVSSASVQADVSVSDGIAAPYSPRAP
jgi:hypothetical protein